MDIDASYPSSLPTHHIKPRDRVVRRLTQLGVPVELLDQYQRGLVAFVKDDKSRIPEVVSAVLPTDEEVAECIRESKPGLRKQLAWPTMKVFFQESMGWLQWLMFEGEPASALRTLANLSVGQRGVCGSIWGQNDIAYRCKTCEHDPTCAICVPCFQNGNHEDHDYSVIYTGGGCCDCGDVTAWKREGFCSKHKGAEQIQPLPDEYANSVGPVLDALLVCWKKKLMNAETTFKENSRANERVTDRKKVATELTFVVVQMLLEFCKQSESLLSFISKRVYSSPGLLEILVRAERFVHDTVVKDLHELLLKLLGEPHFKYEFAKVFLGYYPTVVSSVIKESSDVALKKYPLLPTFSVQIFTVPTLTPRLVKEMNLLTTLLDCLRDIFSSCAGDDGRLQINKWGNLHEITLRVVEDIRFVMSHSGVPSYVTRVQPDITSTWMRLLNYVQGMNPQKRETGLHIEEENEHMHLPFVLGHSIANIHCLLVDGAFSIASGEETDDEIVLETYKLDTDDGDSLRHSKVGRMSQESSACCASGRCTSSMLSPMLVENKFDSASSLLVPPSVTCLTHECLKAIDNWLAVDNTSGAQWSPSSSNIPTSNLSALKRTLSKIGQGRYIFGRLASSSEDHGGQASSHAQSGFRLSSSVQNGKSTGMESRLTVTGESDSANSCTRASIDDTTVEGDGAMDLAALRVSDWPDIVYDVSSQDVSVHIPLHRFLSLLLQKALRRCFGESVVPYISTASVLSLPIYTDFFGKILSGCHPYGFSAFAMEHPLRIRVFCAEVHAGMWRKNGDAAMLSCEWYRSVRWSEQGLELDLFLLQCAAAMAPADPYIYRILERFGLSNYLSLNVERSSEYEPILVQEMLTLIIQIVKGRRFCGLTKTDSLKQELVYKLAIGDSTHSQLVKSLPRDLSKFEQLQKILDEIAVYSNPSGFNQGTYSLHWTFWSDLDLYHPRWNSRDLQVAEERYLRFRGVSALTGQLPRWSKIYPPLKGVARVVTCKAVLQIVRSVLFYAVFTDKLIESRAPDGVLITSLHLLSLALDTCFQHRDSGDLSCYDGDSIPMLAFAGEEISEGLNYGAGEQSLLSLLVLLMRMHKKENSENLSDAGSCNLSSLIEKLLKKFAEIDFGCMTKLQQLAPEVVSDLTQPSPTDDTDASRSASDGEKRKAKARERQAAILAKMRADQAKFMANIDTTADDDSKSEQEYSNMDVEDEPEESAQVVCSLCHDPNSKSPVSYLILLQKSKLMSFVDRGPPSWEHPHQLSKERVTMATNRKTDQPGSGSLSVGSGLLSSSELAQWVQNAVTEFAYHGQPREVDAFLEFFKGQLPALTSIHVPCVSNDEKERDFSFLEISEEDMYLLIQREMQENMSSSSFLEDLKLSAAMGSSSSERRKLTETMFLGKYVAAVSCEMAENPSASDNVRTDKFPKESMHLPACDGFGPEDCDGIVLSSCGHAVHQGCLDRYLHSLKERYLRRIVFEGGHIVDPDQGEFLCPVCRRLANSILPEFPGESQKVLKQPHNSSAGSPNAPGSSYKSCEDMSLLRLQQGLALLHSAANVAFGLETLKGVPLHKNERTSPNLEPVSRVLSKIYLSNRQDKLVGSSRVSHSMLMWDILKHSLLSMEIAARCGRTYTTPTYDLNALYKELESSSGFILSLLLKVVRSTQSENSLNVLQRFRGIQSFADSICSAVSLHHNNIANEPDNMLHIFNNIDTGVSVSDIQFWNRASDPTLSRDPFSSLMWVLFCLPYPFLSCEESLLHLIHVFYAVTVVQAIITYCGKHKCKTSELGVNDCLITDILKLMEESECAQEYFVSNYNGSSDNIRNVIRSLSFPYLRRCALLWKLLTSSFRAPFYDRDRVLDRSHSINDLMDSTVSGHTEFNEIERLENMFKIPPLDFILKDELLRSLSLKWFQHFHIEFKLHRFQKKMHCNPAVPFQLMHLPRVYHDILQRCIKQSCPACNSVLEDPALCLLCGRLCSPNWKSCCRESGCQTHAMGCGAGTGIFLLIKRTTILLQRSARQAPWPSLYLDAFGEEDIDMGRGKPLYLNDERYAALTYMVASHGLDRSSRVLGQTTIGSFFTV
ncbi:E3 ubiquitin-protein ligase PRT6 [Humulus lupulus]|uniref:E3 ubiquitin-protein ligase PRT6 n=1 Tax=Humulus lupulus TaxID=3486 RepID=UPI002B402797|nr:E3 ubiquitin-protein ligase PRT6 [Humulus lupulus]XP_062095625.1 E3 ubiquitin-protein ligase PRT6 [Humulus lupulus]XP_062095626.1 E3 ubiquitin-protein ligase PRT6 [Humulus lupulus]